MKKTKLILIIFLTLMLTMCSEEESEIPVSIEEEIELLTEEETINLMSQKKWNFNYFEFRTSSNHTTNTTDLELEQLVNEFNENTSIKFNSDKTGTQFFNGGTNEDFNWVKNQDTITLNFVDPNVLYYPEYILNSINENELNIYGSFSIINFNIITNHDTIIDIYGNFSFN